MDFSRIVWVRREFLWEEGASVAPATETASVNVPTPSATQGGMTGGSASNQRNSHREDTQSYASVGSARRKLMS